MTTSDVPPEGPGEPGWAAPERPDPPTASAPAPGGPSPSAAWAAPGAAGWAPPGSSPSTPGWGSPAGAVPKPTVNGLAVAALVLGLCCWCFFVPGILAVIFGFLALDRIATSEGRQKGRGMAIAGIVLGWVSIAVLGGLAIAWLAYGLSNA